MNGIIIEGTEKPEKCWDCPMLISMFFEEKSYYACGGDYSDDSPELKEPQTTIPDWCPAKDLIRCKDCRFFWENWRCVAWHQFAMPEWFCSRAERREE